MLLEHSDPSEYVLNSEEKSTELTGVLPYKKNRAFGNQILFPLMRRPNSTLPDASFRAITCKTALLEPDPTLSDDE